jgi:small subunit ribosomal protein S13
MKNEQEETKMKEEPKKKERIDKKPVEKEDLGVIRILSKDIEGYKKVYLGLRDLKGISWSFSNAICKKLKIDKTKKMQQLSKEEIEKIIKFIENPEVPNYLLNRRKDRDSGEDKHLQGSDLDLQKDFDIKRLKKIKSYKGIRHNSGLPVRGQRTKSHFRQNKTVGVHKKKTAPAKSAKGKSQ